MLQRFRSQAGAPGHVLEPTTPEVAIESLIAPARDEEVEAAVGVVIADRGSHRIARSRRPGPVGDVLELPTPLVSIEPARGIRLSRRRVDRTAVAKVDVELPIAIGIEDRHAASHDLGQVMLAPRAVIEAEGDARRCRDLAEDDRSRNLRALARRFRLGGGRNRVGAESREGPNRDEDGESTPC